MILTVALAGCEKNEKGSENEVLPKETSREYADMPCDTEEELTLYFGYATDKKNGFGEIIEIN